MDLIKELRVEGAKMAHGLLSRKGCADGNQCISPLSLFLALGMLYFGAGTRTRETLGLFLGFDPGNNDAGIDQVNQVLDAIQTIEDADQLDLVTGIWVQAGLGFNPSFRQAAKAAMNAHAQSIDFGGSAAVEMINDWVSKATREHVTRIVTPEEVGRNTLALVTDAAYYRASWDRPFRLTDTRAGAFHCADGSKCVVPMMSASYEMLHYARETYAAVGLPHACGRALCIVALPSGNTTLDELIDYLAADGFETLALRFAGDAEARGRRAPATPQEVSVTIPRFTAEWDGDMLDTLARSGLAGIFGDWADFGPMVMGPGARIDAVKHNTVLRFDEEGGHTGKAISVQGSRRMPDIAMAFNRPFLCFICDKGTGVIMFAAAVRAPVSDELTVDALVHRAGFIAPGPNSVVEALHTAVTERDPASVTMMLDSGAPINGKDSRGATALHTAALSGPPEMIHLLLENGADVNAVDETGGTPIWWAAINTKYDHMQMLADHGAWLDHPNIEGGTLLTEAAQGHVTEMVRFLVEREANLHARNPHGETPLLAAVQWIYPDPAVHQAVLDIVEMLLSSGGDPNDEMPDGTTPLLRVAESDAWRVARCLIDFGADLERRDRTGCTPLLRAAIAGNAKMVALLLSRGADPSAVDVSGDNVVLLAQKRGHANVIEALLKSGKNFGQTE